MDFNFTLQDLHNTEPCYEDDQLAKLVGNQNEWTLQEMLRMEHVPAADRVWLACALCALRARRGLGDLGDVVRFAQWCSDRAAASAKYAAAKYAAAIACVILAAHANASAHATAASTAAAGATAASTAAAAGAARAARDLEHQKQIEWWIEA